jgi:hypothetical protein
MTPEQEKEFDEKFKPALISAFGYKTPDDGMQRKIVAEQAYFNLKNHFSRTLQTQTRKHVEVLEGLKPMLPKECVKCKDRLPCDEICNCKCHDQVNVWVALSDAQKAISSDRI